MLSPKDLYALLEFNRKIVTLKRHITVAHLSTFLGIATWSRGAYPISIKELANRLGIADATAARHVRYLGEGERAGQEGLGLVKSFANPDDGRERLLELTPHGYHFLSHADALLDGSLKGFG